MRHLPRSGTVALNVDGGGTVNFWSRGDDYITSRLWWMGTAGYEEETALPFLRFVDQARVVIDVGAYTGYYSLLAAARNPQARIFAFEPNPRVSARLGHNLDLNPSLDVTMVPFAVGAARGIAPFHLGGPGLALSSSLDGAWEGLHRTITVVVTDLDSFADEWELDRVDVVKIDVESAEEAVLQGMSRLIARCRPVIFLEVLPGDERGHISDELRRRDYELFYLTFAGPVQEAKLDSTESLVDHAHTPFNHLLCPTEKIPPWLRLGPNGD